MGLFYIEVSRGLYVELEPSQLLLLPLPIQEIADAQFGYYLAGTIGEYDLLTQYMELVLGVGEKSDDYSLKVDLD